MNTIFYYIMIIVLVVVMIPTLPKSWKKERWQRCLIALYCVCAVASFQWMISVALFSESESLRTALVYLSLLFFTVSAGAITIFLLRYALSFFAIRAKAWKTVRLLLRDEVYAVGVLLFTLFFLLVGGEHFDSCLVTKYDVNLTDGTNPSPRQCRVGLVADIHLGAGADREAVDRMCERLEGEKLDLICVAGDVVDMTSYEADVHYFAQKLSEVSTRYGIYYVEGNHEADSEIDSAAILRQYGFICLYDQALQLDNGLVIVGRRDAREREVEDILTDSGFDPTQSALVLSHQPMDYEELDGLCCLMLSGHTHGFQIPLYGIVNPFISEMSYGYHEFGSVRAITTSGVSAWGFRISWPSYSEICSIKLVF